MSEGKEWHQLPRPAELASLAGSRAETHASHSLSCDERLARQGATRAGLSPNLCYLPNRLPPGSLHVQ
jgi:hypothetical protein